MGLIGFWRGRGAGVFRSDLRVCARVPRAGGGWLLVGACLVRAFSWYGGSLVVARGWWSVWARALAGLFSGGDWLVGGCGVLECWVAVWLVGVFMGGRAIGGRGDVWLAGTGLFACARLYWCRLARAFWRGSVGWFKHWLAGGRGGLWRGVLAWGVFVGAGTIDCWGARFRGRCLVRVFLV